MFRNLLVKDEYYHVFTKSIAGFQILRNFSEQKRMLDLIRYYQFPDVLRFSDFIKRKGPSEPIFGDKFFEHVKDKDRLVRIVAYCLMPTHVHLILQQLSDQGISVYMSNVLNGYTRYFNLKIKRKGPLWQGRFKRVRVENDQQLLHLTRYLHLNPVTSGLVEFPQDWHASSFDEFSQAIDESNRICQFQDVLDIHKEDYKKFVNDRISYQRELQLIKHFILE